MNRKIILSYTSGYASIDAMPHACCFTGVHVITVLFIYIYDKAYMRQFKMLIKKFITNVCKRTTFQNVA